MKKKLSLFISFYNNLQKSWKFFKVLITLIIWVAIAYFVYEEKDQFLQIFTQSPLEWKWLLYSMMLLSINIGFEAFKWYWMVKKFYPSLGYWKAYQAILTGSASAFITPQKIGDYVGRLLYIPPKSRVSATIATVLDRFSQLGATFIFTIFATFYLQFSSFYIIIIFLITLIFHIALWNASRCFFYISHLVPKIAFLNDTFHQIPISLQVFTSFLSVGRFVVFLAQYILIFKAFGIYQDNLWALCCLTFFIKSLVPSVAFSELGIREGVAIWIFNTYSNIEEAIVFQVTFILFIINTLIPATIGSLLIKNVKI